MSGFVELTSGARVDPARWEWSVPDGWQQGRGAFGGLVIAALARALEAHVGDPERTLRSLTAVLPGATLAGPAMASVGAATCTETCAAAPSSEAETTA